MNNEDIIKIVADVFGINAVRMSSKDRSKDVTIAKIAYCGLVKDIQKATTINVLLGISAPSMRKYISECSNLLKTNKRFANKYNTARKEIESL